MHNFEYRQGELYCEQVPVSQIAKQVGTPCYIYSHATLLRHIRAYDSAFKNIPHLSAFAMKANSNLAILRLMAKEGSGVDIVSGGELFRALKAGVAEVYAIYLAPEWFGAGVGRRLLDRTVEALGGLGFRDSTLWVLEVNDRARRFYEAAGWRWDRARSMHADAGLTEPILRYRQALHDPAP